MTKKQSKIKNVKKVVKPTKTKPVSKKEQPKKNVKAVKGKPLVSKGTKPAPKVIKKKIVAPVKKKVVSKVSKKIVSKPVKSSNKKIAKPTEPAKKKAIDSKVGNKKITVVEQLSVSKKTVKPETKVAKKAAVPAKPAKDKAVDKSVKVVKENNSPKKEKPKKADKKERDDEDDDFMKEVKKPAKKSKGGRKPKKNADDDDEPVIENDLLVEQLINSTKRMKKPPKVPTQLRTFTNPMTSLTVAKGAEGTKKVIAPKKEPKGKFELEYVMHTSSGILYEFITSPSGLSEWFADDVNIHDGVFTFFWEGSEQKARLLGFKDEKFVKLQWLDKPEGTYFEFRIERDDLTGDVSLIVTDFADEAADMQTSKLLWDSQINKLLHVIGSY